MGHDDKLPAYADTVGRKEPSAQSPDEDETHTVWLTFTGDCTNSSPTTILLPSSSTFFDFQAKIKQRYLETRSIAADRIAFIWSTFLVETGSSVSDTDSRRDAANGIYLDEHNWDALKPTILTIPRPESSSERLQKKKLHKLGDVSSFSECTTSRLIVTFCDIDWTETRRAAKNPEMLERQQKAHERNERAYLLQGRHLPPPRMSTCVLM
ncbi:hypothetical protein M409DRAFT_60707 [Zasmidium cellare ATCC 36951]|uniref:Uncharacterized protein n=1 Tax=Zasmidium cellare ATCC 36951 TaxID=1080233 RepID=A0A6A6C1E7_ZASCE|nr:uncharacterized protein M409DRAFT_60707 [Zasmidium cellare ATCC 36951]KAF2159642.1 hypothetical protein M409DRAFT_60707 [Zasmidium cellare ATCC 36951]